MSTKTNRTVKFQETETCSSPPAPINPMTEWVRHLELFKGYLDILKTHHIREFVDRCVVLSLGGVKIIIETDLKHIIFRVSLTRSQNFLLDRQITIGQTSWPHASEKNAFSTSLKKIWPHFISAFSSFILSKDDETSPMCRCGCGDHRHHAFISEKKIRIVLRVIRKT